MHIFVAHSTRYWRTLSELSSPASLSRPLAAAADAAGGGRARRVLEAPGVFGGPAAAGARLPIPASGSSDLEKNGAEGRSGVWVWCWIGSVRDEVLIKLKGTFLREAIGNSTQEHHRV